MNVVSDIFGTKNRYSAATPVNKFQAQQAPLVQQNYTPTIGAAQAGATNQMGANAPIQAQESALAQQLAAQAQGQGPSPAQAMLTQATGQNINAAAGQAASARGVNPALAMRTAVDAAGQANQTAAGQAATLKAQEQLAAEGQLTNVLQGQAGQNIGQQVANTQLLGTTGGLQQGQQALQLQNVLGTEALNEQVAAQNAGLQLGAEQINAGVAAQNAQTAGNMFGGVMQAAGSLGALALLANQGGEIPAVPRKGYDAGGNISSIDDYLDFHAGTKTQGPATPQFGPTVGATAGGMNQPVPYETGANAPNNSYMPYAPPTPTSAYSATPAAAGGNKEEAQKVAGALGEAGKQMGGQGSQGAYDRFSRMHVTGAYMADGGSIYSRTGPVPGTPRVDGDSPKNDTVPAALSPGEYVVKRTAMQQPGVRELVEAINEHPQHARSLVQHLVRRSGTGGYGRVLRARRMSDGGSTEEEPSLMEKIQSWIASPESEDRSKAVADAAAADIPVASDARKSIRQHNAKLEEVDKATQQNQGGSVRTARGIGRERLRSSMSVSKKPRHKEA